MLQIRQFLRHQGGYASNRSIYMSRKVFMRHIICRMPKQIPEQELKSILAIVAAHPDGIPIRIIRGGLAYEMPPRMLQRRLALLVEQGRLLAEGRGKGRRYRLPRDSVVLRVEPGQLAIQGHPAQVEVYPTVSPEAEAIKQAVRAPIQNRQPVGYQRAFLDDYRPNVTYYLSAETRQHLHKVARPQDSERPAGTYARSIYRPPADRSLLELKPPGRQYLLAAGNRAPARTGRGCRGQGRDWKRR